MAREITHEEQGPKPIGEDELEEQGGSVYICQCGLSDNQPFCDGSHKATEDEADGTLYKYENDDSDGERNEIEKIRYNDE